MNEQKAQGSKMMWSFVEKRYVPAEDYYEIDGDCRLDLPDPSIAHCPSENESLNPSVVEAEHSGLMGMPNRNNEENS